MGQESEFESLFQGSPSRVDWGSQAAYPKVFIHRLRRVTGSIRIQISYRCCISTRGSYHPPCLGTLTYNPTNTTITNPITPKRTHILKIRKWPTQVLDKAIPFTKEQSNTTTRSQTNILTKAPRFNTKRTHINPTKPHNT